MGRQNLARAQIGDADGVLELLWLLFTTVRAAARPHQDLVLENLLLRHQLAVLARRLDVDRTASAGHNRLDAYSVPGDTPAPPGPTRRHRC